MEPELLKNLRETLTYYKYRGINWITRVGKPVIFPNEKSIVFENFYSSDGNMHEGVCQELAYQAFLDIKKYHSDLYNELKLYRVVGGDPAFFSRPPTELVDRFGNVVQTSPRTIRGQHVFLAITDSPILKYGETMSGQQAYDLLQSANAYIFDPSFQVLQPLKESGYLVEQIWAPGCQLGIKTGSEIFFDSHVLSSNSIIGISNGVIIGLNAYFTGEYPSSDYNIEIRLITPMAQDPIIVSVFSSEIVYLVKYLKDLDILLVHSQREWKTATVGTDLNAHRSQIEYW